MRTAKTNHFKYIYIYIVEFYLISHFKVICTPPSITLLFLFGLYIESNKWPTGIYPWNIKQDLLANLITWLQRFVRPLFMLHKEATMQIFAFSKVADGKQIIFYITEVTNAVAGIGRLWDLKKYKNKCLSKEEATKTFLKRWDFSPW